MVSSRTSLIISIAAIVLGFVAIFFLGSLLEKYRISLPANYEDEDLAFQGKRMKGYALGAEGLIADWYWMQSLQYIGNKLVRSNAASIDLGDLRSLNPRLLFPLLDNATDLDPQFMAAYSYGATVLPAVDGEQAIKLTEKGISNNPGQWRLYQYLGYIYWQSKDYERAAETYERGSEIPGAPVFFKQMTAAMKTQGGDRATARQIYEQTLAEAPDQSTKDNARRRLMELDSRDDREALDGALGSFKEKRSRCAESWRELLPILTAVKLPAGRDFQIDPAGNVVDPSDAPYLINKETCTAKLDPAKTNIANE